MPSNQEVAMSLVEGNRFALQADGNTAEVDQAGLVTQIAEALTEAKTPEGQRNRYDRRDRVTQVGMLRANSLKIAAYRVRDPETDEWSPIQFHMTWDNCVMGVMGEAAAELFTNFVRQTMGRELGLAAKASYTAAPAPVPSAVLDCLAFFASCIRSGESWSPTCDDMLAKAKAAMRAA